MNHSKTTYHGEDLTACVRLCDSVSPCWKSSVGELNQWATAWLVCFSLLSSNVAWTCTQAQNLRSNILPPTSGQNRPKRSYIPRNPQGVTNRKTNRMSPPSRESCVPSVQPNGERQITRHDATFSWIIRQITRTCKGCAFMFATLVMSVRPTLSKGINKKFTDLNSCFSGTQQALSVCVSLSYMADNAWLDG